LFKPSSVPVDRRARRAKSDGIDAELLLRTLRAWLRGEPHVCSMVPIPDEADEDERRRTREREDLMADRVSLVNRIGAVLATLGVDDYNPLRRDRRGRLESLRTALGDPLPPHARARILRMRDRLDLVRVQIAELEQERDAVLEKEAPDKTEKLSRPECGIVVGYSPAGCEVCRERPAVTRAQPWMKTEPRHALAHERQRDEKSPCEIPPHVRPDTRPPPNRR
jgi:transposase